MLHRKLKNGLKHIAGLRLVSHFDFDMYAPFSRGPNQEKTTHSIEATNIIFSLLEDVSAKHSGQFSQIISAEEFARDHLDNADALKVLLDAEGSDKANKHNYHLVLGRILADPETKKAVLEIGLGTNNPKIVSNMTVKGRPGASVRAFRNHLPNAMIYGADFDRDILFEEDRIKTFFVDQTNEDTFMELAKNIPSDLDLIIDDGLHSPTANIRTFNFALGRLGVGGWVVVEDINPKAIPIWRVVSRLLPEQYEAYIISCTHNPVFAVRRLS